MTARIALILILIIEVLLLLAAFALRKKENEFKFISLLAGIIATLTVTVTILFPEQVATAINSEPDKYTSESQGPRSEKVSFSDVSDVLYNGRGYWKYVSTNSSSFTVAGKAHNVGFVIGCDQSLFGDGDGFALFNLQGKYTEMEFDVGKTDDYEIQNVTLNIFVDGELKVQCELSGEVASKHITTVLNNAENVKISLTGGSRVKYGFYNVEFTT